MFGVTRPYIDPQGDPVTADLLDQRLGDRGSVDRDDERGSALDADPLQQFGPSGIAKEDRTATLTMLLDRGGIGIERHVVDVLGLEEMRDHTADAAEAG